jgi:hypothetical protein
MGYQIRPRRSAAIKVSTAFVTAGIVGAGGFVAAPADASSGALSVTAIAAPVAMAGHAVPVTVTVVNPQAALFCGSMRLHLVWWRTGGRHHQASESSQPTAGAAITTMTIPASTRAGTVHYRVHGSQTCGLLGSAHPTYLGSSTTDDVQII